MANSIEIQKVGGTVEDLVFSMDTVTQVRKGVTYELQGIHAGVIPYSSVLTVTEKLDDLESRVGIPGPQGPVGPVGPQGPIGLSVVGPEGPQGIQGVPGPEGSVGPIGPEGPEGVQGPVGPGIIVTGSGKYEDIIALPFPQLNDLYIITEDSPPNMTGDGLFWDGTAWINVGNIQGPQGVQGPQGPIGPQGPVGPQGPNGIDGIDGTNGINGGIVQITALGTTMDLSIYNVLISTLTANQTIVFNNLPGGGTVIWYVNLKTNGFTPTFSLSSKLFTFDEVPMKYTSNDILRFQTHAGTAVVSVSRVWSAEPINYNRDEINSKMFFAGGF